MLRRALIALLGVALVAAAALAQAGPKERLGLARQTLERVEGLIESKLNDTELQTARAEVEPVRAELSDLQATLAPLRDAARARLQRLGDEPAAGDPPEASEIGHIRARERAVFGELDAATREAELLATRADQIVARITDERRGGFTRTLTERTASVIDPGFWIGALASLPDPVSTAMSILVTAWESFTERARASAIIVALIVVGAGLLAARFVRHRIRLARTALEANARLPRRLAATLDGALVLSRSFFGAPVIALLLAAVIEGLDLTTATFGSLFANAVATPVAVAVMFHAMAQAILAPDRPRMRLPDLSDWAVGRILSKARLASIVLGAGLAMEAVGRAVVASVEVMTALNMLVSGLTALVAISALLTLRDAPSSKGDPEADDVPNRLDFLRPILWIIALAILGALVAGYSTLAAFIGFYTLVVLFVASLATLLLAGIDAGLTDWLVSDQNRNRALASTIGVTQKNVSFAATLLSGFLRFATLALAFIVLAGPLGFYTEDILSTVERAWFGFKVGEITISPSGILIAVGLFLVIVVVTRVVRGWVHNTLLPRTTLDAGLRNSIATVIGYTGIVLAIIISLSQIGLNLQNVAIVAGALSVGIGFGLQSIVSNFVSGLILLAERPVRVGDIITVKGGEEGYVRRISVRATEIETYDRATLIIPNSELITGVVKNWVYGNTWARVKVSIKVAYDQDVEQVRRIMLTAAKDDPRILPSPSPRVFLANLGDAMDFELIAVVASVETSLAVKSDLHMRIMTGFREAGLRLAGMAAPAGPTIVRIEREPKAPSG